MASSKKTAEEFVKRWKAKEGSEDREARSFWIELCGEVLGISNPTHVLDFERKVQGRKVDVFFEDVGVLIEHKSRGVSLDAPEQRGWINKAQNIPRMVTPFEQAKWYADNITPRSIAPKWVITCNFDELRIYDLDIEYASEKYETITLDDLPKLTHRLSFITRKENSRLEREKQLSIKAGEVVGRLYDAFSSRYHDIENDEEEQRSLNILITRIVFLLYAEDADLLQERNAFYGYLKNFQVQHMRQALIDLFQVLKTPEEERDPYLSQEVAAFPYVNGGLFEADIIIPQFDIKTHDILLNEASAEFDWSDISPTIFGAVFESTLNPETRRAGGMHYTSVENIHKVTGPLFYDALKDELTAIEGLKSQKEREFKLRAFRTKIASLKILDPACGSGNFLTETYLSLRKLENRVLENLYGGQMVMGLLDPIQVSTDQFYGIEINDFAVEVAKTALWIAELQMLDETREILNMWIDALPLKSNNNIHEGNALRMDWNDVLPSKSCSYLCGNPPFLGSSIRTKAQTADLEVVFGDEKKWGKCDYCVGWYRKAADYMRGTDCRAALVSTNSITQGEQVEPTWRRLFDMGLHIDFAWLTFVWNSEAIDQAHVHCVIVGFSYTGKDQKKLYTYDGNIIDAQNINGYLVDAPNVFVASRARAVDEHHLQIVQGCKPVDGGNLIIKPEEYDGFIARNPSVKPYVLPFIGATEFMNGKERWCLWLKGAPKEAYESCPEVIERLSRVSEMRLASPTKEFREYANHPELFVQDRQPSDNYLVFPSHTSSRRPLVPVGFLSPTTIVSNAVYVIPSATLYDFGIVSSTMHNAWLRVVAGRIKSDYRFTPGVYLSFAYPEPSVIERATIESCAQEILDVRDAHPGQSLANLYDPDHMPADLRAAHRALDAAVETAYGINFNGDEEKIVAHLFKLYAEKNREA